MTLCVPAASPWTTNSVCPRPRWTMPATPAGIVSLGGVSVRLMNKWWCVVPDRSSLRIHQPITTNRYGPAVQCWSKTALRSAAIASGGRPSMSDRSSMYMSRPSLKSPICGDEGG